MPNIKFRSNVLGVNLGTINRWSDRQTDSLYHLLYDQKEKLTAVKVSNCQSHKNDVPLWVTQWICLCFERYLLI